MKIREQIMEALANRILILDGAMGSMIQAFRSADGKALDEKDFRGERFASHHTNLKGCNDILCLTKPEVILGIHEAYLEAGADIIETCSLNATVVSLKDYGLESMAREISRAAAALARKAADKFSAPGKPRFVAGSIGPTAKSSFFTQDIDNPGERQITWDELEAAYFENAQGLIEGGADFLLIETIYDGLNAKAALFAIKRLSVELARDIPVMISVTVSESGRMLTGQTPEAFCVSMLHSDPLALGFNCSFGTEALKAPLQKLSAFAPCPVIFYPNAGMPDRQGQYSDTPEIMANAAETCMKEGLVNIIGGCCGSTPAHIAAIAGKAKNYKPRPIPALSEKGGRQFFLAGTQIAEIENAGEPDQLLSIKRKIPVVIPWQNEIDQGNSSEAVEIARETDDISILAISPDQAPDPVSAVKDFIFLASAFSELAKLPILIKSSRWDVIENGLKCFHGKGLVQYTSHEAGQLPNDFKEKSEVIRSYGAVPVS